MKKILFLSGLFCVNSFFLFSVVHADCNYAEIEPVCGINGQTFTNSCEGWSDTSSWEILPAYEGQCVDLPPLPQSLETKIETIMLRILRKFKNTDMRFYMLTPKGQDFVMNALFPRLQKLISTEMKKDSPDLLRVAVFTKIASMIKYDFAIDGL